MLRTSFIAALLILSITAASASATTDPRRCPGTRTAASCARDNAFLAVRYYLSRRYRLPYSTSWGSGTHACAARNRKLTVWRCTWSDGVTAKGSPGSGAAVVTFRAFSNGWHSRVRVVA